MLLILAKTMFASNFIGHFTKLYTYSCCKVTFFLPSSCKSTLRTFAIKKTSTSNHGRKTPPKSNVALTNQHLKEVNNISKISYEIKAKRNAYIPRNIATEYMTPNTKVNATTDTTPKVLTQRISPFEGLKEFFSHPLTWDRNNGYLNMLLALAIFGYSFCTTCGAEAESPSKISYKDSGK